MAESFAQGQPNEHLMSLARTLLDSGCGNRVLDIGCGAGRNAVPLAAMGYDVWGVDSSAAMIAVGQGRSVDREVAGRLRFLKGSMTELISILGPELGSGFDLIVAHGIWNLSTSDHELESALHEATACARKGTVLFVFTFSRATLDQYEKPLAHQRYVYRGLNGSPQCFLQPAELTSMLEECGFFPYEGHAPVQLTSQPKFHRMENYIQLGNSPVFLEGIWQFLPTKQGVR